MAELPIIDYLIWAATWQNQQNECVPSKDSDQSGHPPSLMQVFAVRMKNPWVLSYVLLIPLRWQCFPCIAVAPKSDQQPDGPFYNWVGNQDGHLPCVASANPLPVFRWLRADGNEITSADPFFSVVREEHRNDKVKYPKQEKEKFTVTSKLMVRSQGCCFVFVLETKQYFLFNRMDKIC